MVKFTDETPSSRMKKIRVKEVKLGRQQAHGQASENGLIEIDPRLRNFKQMKIEIHERLHTLCWDMKEKEVARISYHLARFLYTDRKYRKLK